MTRGHPPHVAIGEAGRKAKARGCLVLVLEPAGELPFHFVTCSGNRISLIRVRRLKYPGFTVEEIEHSCRNDIAALRSVTVTAEIFRELWVRGPDRHWYRYFVQPDSLEVIEDDDVPDIVSMDDKPDSVKPDGIKPDRNEDGGVKPVTMGVTSGGVSNIGVPAVDADVLPPAERVAQESDHVNQLGCRH
jgi:hypothetical protein